MNCPIAVRSKTPRVPHPTNRQRGFPVVLLAFTWLALSSPAHAVSPPPDGGYPGFNTAEGTSSLQSLTTGEGNTAIGDHALALNATGSSNTAIGVSALTGNVSGDHNTAVGAFALEHSKASGNTATGFEALFVNTTGFGNTATGGDALLNNDTGSNNTANGIEALGTNTAGSDNTASGAAALQNNTTGNDNTATGFQALLSNTTGPDNTATGFDALRFNTTGADNTANGFQALDSNTTGSENTAVGIFALASNTIGRNNTAEGSGALGNATAGSNNIAMGFNAGLNLKTGSNNIILGANVPGTASDANTIRIGKQGTQTKTFIAGIRGATVAGGVGVTVGTNGQLGVATSSARFKEAVKPMDKASETILALKPVTFRYKQELDPDKIPQFGLIAEEVARVDPDLVGKDEDGKINTVRYEAVNAMLLNEFLKEHAKVRELERQIQALTAALQKVSDRLELRNKARPQLVVNE
ncbi:MAG: hypothetical protein DMF40_07725 [Verrucomicrobia bacterium]|nr:MAG: hypothetical protein DMF40_07725 [Verrucomicrobiota bacterium]